jgi:hypothetical protein
MSSTTTSSPPIATLLQVVGALPSKSLQTPSPTIPVSTIIVLPSPSITPPSSTIVFPSVPTSSPCVPSFVPCLHSSLLPQTWLTIPFDSPNPTITEPNKRLGGHFQVHFHRSYLRYPTILQSSLSFGLYLRYLARYPHHHLFHHPFCNIHVFNRYSHHHEQQCIPLCHSQPRRVMGQ